MLKDGDKIGNKCLISKEVKNNMENILMGEHNVWKILKKDRYTEEGIKKMEQIYDFLSVMKNTLGDLTIQEFFNMLNENNDEVFFILSTMARE